MINCRSVINKVDEFTALLESVKADIVFGTESWLNPTIADSEVFPNEFIVYRKDRPSLGGGVFLLVHSSLKLSRLDIDHDDVESIWCSVTLSDNSSYAVGTFYRPPNSDLKTFGRCLKSFRRPLGILFY